MKFREHKGLDLSQINKDILRAWDERHIFERSLELRANCTPFVFFEGPPSANGVPGIHHVMARAIKDIFCRYKTQKGFLVERKAGWDTHGLPVELAVEKMLGITKEDIGKKISIEEYNAACRKEVMKYTDLWERLTREMGYWVDMSNPYITYDNRYIETLWYLLKQLYDKNLIYKGYTIQPYSPAAGTGLSSHELNQPGCYRDVKDTTCIAMFEVGKDSWGEVVDLQQDKCAAELAYFLAWTTTPWTLPSNTALCVGANIEYVIVRTYNPYSGEPCRVILAKDLLGKYFPEKNKDLDFNAYKQGDKNIPFMVLGKCSGKQLAGMHYKQLFPWVNAGEGAFRVITGDFVATEDGTGIVHIAPTFGADDDRVAKTNGIPPLMLIDRAGNRQPMVDKTGKFFAVADLDPAFVQERVNIGLYTQYAGRFVKNDYDPKLKDTDTTLDVDLCVELKQRGQAFRIEKYVHSYPHCWRTDKPVLYYPLDSWFIRTTACKERMMELNNTITWKPESTGTGRFGKWLENLQDWNLSRSRYWGTPLPIWRTADGTETKCIGSMAELMAEIDKAIAAGVMAKNPYAAFKVDEYTKENYEKIDLHRPFVDDVVLVSANGQPMRRELDLIDVWFDSGAMPYAQKSSSPSPSLPIRGGGSTAYQTARNSNYNLLKELAKNHRKDQTQAESILWEYLKGKQADDCKFRRQHIIDEFIVDFVCLEKNLVVEVDGGYHNQPDMIEADKLRTEILQSLGFRVARYTNEEITGDIDGVLKSICKHLQVLPYGEDLGGAFTADFIAEGVDQTRGWFFTLHAISTMVSNTVAFKNVVSNGLVLDKNGNKMSKRLGNAVDPFEAIEKYGSDPLRWYMITNSQPWDNLKFDIEGVDEVKRKFFGTLYNTYSFFALYANVDGFIGKEEQVPVNERAEIDRWIISLLNTLIKEVDESYATYEPTRAGRLIQDFVGDNLSNWYVRLNRKRFWGGEYNKDKVAAYQTLYTCLETVAILASPIAPFYTDQLYGDLVAGRTGECHSVHLTDFPKYNTALIDKELEERMALAQQASSMVLALRRKVNIKVRQPLTKLMIPVLDPALQTKLEAVQQLVLNEVNVKAMEFLTDTTGVMVKKIKPNFKTLGPRYGKQMKDISAAVEEFAQQDIAEFERIGTCSLSLASGQVDMTLEDVEITSEDIPGWLVATEGKLTIALDITVTDDLRREGIARELINRIQNIRKESNFDVTDKIRVSIEANADISEAVTTFKDYIAAQTLAADITLAPVKNGVDIELDDEVIVKIAVERI